jgi:hypothetical protein
MLPTLACRTLAARLETAASHDASTAAALPAPALPVLLLHSCWLAARLYSWWVCLLASCSWCKLTVPGYSLFVSANAQYSVRYSDLLQL